MAGLARALGRTISSSMSRSVSLSFMGKWGPSIRLSQASVAENAADGSTIGTLSVVNGTGTWTFTKTADPDAKFGLTGADLTKAAAVDYETKTAHSVTIEATNGTSTITRTFNIGVVNVLELTLAALSMSPTSFAPSAAAGTVIGTVSGLVDGSSWAVFPNDGRVAKSGNNLVVGLTQSTGDFSITLRHTHPDAVNSPLDTTVQLTVTAAGVTYSEWTGPGWFDASDSLVTSGSTVTAFNNKRPGGEVLTGAGTAANRTRVAAGQNGRDILRIVRDVSGPTTAPSLASQTGTALSVIGEGDDKPYTVLLAFKPTDANTGFPWAWSNNNGAEVQNVGLVRRAASASSVRRQPAASIDVSFGTGLVAGTAYIVAVRHTGKLVSVWSNSLVKVLSDVPQDTAPLVAGAVFRIGSGIIAANAGQTAQCNMDIFEVVVDDTARSDVDITTSISDLAAKWGITLS